MRRNISRLLTHRLQGNENGEHQQLLIFRAGLRTPIHEHARLLLRQGPRDWSSAFAQKSRHTKLLGIVQQCVEQERRLALEVKVDRALGEAQLLPLSCIDGRVFVALWIQKAADAAASTCWTLCSRALLVGASGWLHASNPAGAPL